jgi:ATP-dependent DNA helicase RecG
MELTSLKGCGPKTAEHLKAADIHSVEDFTTLIPRRYDVRHLETEVSSSAGYYPAVVLTKPTLFAIRRNLKRLQFKAELFGETITLSLFNQVHWLKHLAPGVEIVVYGVFNRLMTAQKCYLKKSFHPGIMPVYGIKHVADAKVQQFVLDAIYHVELKENLPAFMVEKYQLIPNQKGLIKRHQPQDLDDLIPVERRDKVTFLFIRQLEHIHLVEQGLKIQKNVSIKDIDPEIKALPFELTPSQHMVVKDLLKGINTTTPIRHLLQGDTGSGKTVVAFLVALTLLKKGDQVALMAPTEILASQHFKTFKSLFSAYKAVFLTGAMGPKETQEALHQIKSQKGLMIIGTHALFSNKTLYHHLTLAIIDEQHRFGVAQRQKLLNKGPAVDFISLSATPIPRTLALTLYQGMEVSILSEKPKGRQPVTTSLMPLKEAKACDVKIEETLNQKKQVFIIAPRIEDDDQLLSVERIEKYYQDRFKTARIKTLHGQQESERKEITLSAFAGGEVDILIATTVVEVGIDIKNATLMLVYHAERFGLAQLHQLRGRLGRHLDAGACILLYRGKTDVKQRLHLLQTIDDGFTLSQKDLETRGFGTLFGLQQSGFSQMQTWPYEETLRLMESVQDDVQTFLKLPKETQEKVPFYTKLFKTA